MRRSDQSGVQVESGVSVRSGKSGISGKRDLRRGDQIGLPDEPIMGTVLELRGGEHDRTIIRHLDDSGWLVDGGTEPLSWFEVFRLLMTEPGLRFKVIDARKRCQWVNCRHGGWLPVGAPENQKYCHDSCRTLAARDRQNFK